MSFKDIHTSKTVRGILIGLGIAILALGIFKLGMVAGAHKARFSEHFGDTFNRTFEDPRHGFFRNEEMPGGHGSVGNIVSITLPSFIVADKDNVEKTIIVGTSTLIRQFRDEITSADLKVGEHVVVLGQPNDKGEIEAKLVRVMPAQQ